MKNLNVKATDRILIISPHPDDESIACGGILCTYGMQCDVCLCTDGSKCRTQLPSSVIKRIRMKEFKNAMDFCNVKQRIMLNITDGTVDKAKSMFRSLDVSKYDIIFVPQKKDGHKDHRNIYRQFVFSLYKYHKKLKRGAVILQYEVWTPLENPSRFLDITSFIDKKKNLIGIYESQLKNVPYIQMALGLNAYRGAYQNVAYAECYQEVKIPLKMLLRKGEEKKYE
ncbi:MAG: PIG-L family deacetylase [Lachnospiraceae bacterium]|nr:PIG-L family deacetylase [Lachnospiraceae bacterium]MDE7239160.1 PIG-L family deacetylase [Lachnospiraceae bacterium]